MAKKKKNSKVRDYRHDEKRKNNPPIGMVNENLEALKAMFPEALTEDGVEFEVLRQLLGDAIPLGLYCSKKRFSQKLH